MNEIKPRNSEQSKECILKAAEEEFAQKGLAGARMDEIARASGYNKSLIYQYFGGKEELYRLVIYRVYSRLSVLENVIISKEMDYVECIRILVTEYFRFLENDPNFVSIIMRENLEQGKYIMASGALELKDPMLRALKKIVESGKAEGKFAADVDEKQVMLSLISGAFSYFSNRYTLSQVIRLDLGAKETMEKRICYVIGSILHYLKNGAGSKGEETI